MSTARWFWLVFCMVMSSIRAFASGLEATLDRYEITVPLGPPTSINVTLHNKGFSAIYLTGLKVELSEGASGTVYNPTELRNTLFKLAPGQSWDGPLVAITANRRGPLLVKGTIQLLGGGTSVAVGTITVIPIQLTIDDPRRKPDGGYDERATASCDRSLDQCCDTNETTCFQMGKQCIYVAEGYNRQQLCVNDRADKGYEQILDLNVSTDAAHIAYIAATHCVTDGTEELCQRTVVIDHTEKKTSGVATNLQLSPDGRHYAYEARGGCILSGGRDQCSGPKRFIVDGKRESSLPLWYASHGN